MALPSNYTRVGNFTTDESSSASGRSTVKTAVLDSELNTVATIIADINTNIGYAIRSDGQIKDGFVKPHGFGISASTGFLKYDSSSSTWSFAADPTALATDAKNDAQKLATNPEDSQYTLSDGITTGYSSLHYSEKASASSTSATSSSTTASSKATEAENWATKTDGVVPSTSEYSAKEYSQGSQASTGGSSKNWATQTGADVTGASTGSMSAKEWSIGTLGRGVAGEGSAKDWATRTGATVDDADYSAKEHAVGSTVTGGSSKDWATKAEDSIVSGGSYSAKHWSAKAQDYADQAASGTGWFSEAATVAYVSGTSFTVSGDVTGVYVANRRLNMTVGGSSVFSHITSSSYSAPNTTVNINDSVLTASFTAVKYSVVFGGNTGNINPHSHNDDENGGIIQQLDWLESSVVSNTVRILESDGLSMVHTTAGLVDEFESNTAAETAIDASASSGEQYDSSADCYQQVPGATGANDDKDYTVESNYIQQEWTTAIVGSSNATFTNGSATVTISSGTWPTNCANGRISQDGTNWYDISSRDSATQLTLSVVFAQSTVTGTFDIRLTEFDSGVVKLNVAGGGATSADVSLALTGGTGERTVGDSTSGQEYSGQTVTTVAGGILESIVFPIKRVGSPTDNYYVEVTATSSNVPTGSVLATSDNVDVSSISTSYYDQTFTFSGANRITLSAATQYAFYMRRSGALNGSNLIHFDGESTSTYSGGSDIFYRSSSWIANLSYEHDFVLNTTPASANVITEYVSVADSYAQSSDVSAWSDINSSAITETLNSQNAYYWVIFSAASGYGANTEVSIFNQTGSVWRVIAKNSAGTWQYNNNASHDATQTLVTSTVNDMLHAVSQAISTQAANRMTGTEAAAISDAEWVATNGFATSDTLLTRGLTLVSSSASQNPEVSLFRVNYDASNAALDLRTKIWNGSSGMPTAPTAITTVYVFFIDNGVSATYYYTIDGTNFVEISSFDDTWVYATGKTARRKTISLPGGVGTDPRVKAVVAQGSSIYQLHALGLQVR